MAKSSTTKIGNATVKGATEADKQTIEAAKASVRADEADKTQVTKPNDQTPEAKATPKAKSAAAEKMFKDADQAVMRGLSPDITVEQHANLVRKAALGY